MPETATKAPSFASVLHRLACGEEVSGAELLALPHFDDCLTDYPVCEPLDYYLDQVPELIAFAGGLAEHASPGSAVLGFMVASDLMQLVEAQGVVMEVTQEMRALLWQLGADADLATRLTPSRK